MANLHGARLQKQLRTALILSVDHLIPSVSRPQRPLIRLLYFCILLYFKLNPNLYSNPNPFPNPNPNPKSLKIVTPPKT
jgi:hypothetical protein